MRLRRLEEHASFGGVQGFYEVTSASCAGPIRFGVYRPPRAARENVRVLVVLGDAGEDERSFAERSGVQRKAAELGMMIVTPDSCPREALAGALDDAGSSVDPAATFYVDSVEAPWARTYQMFTFLTEELPAVLSEAFPADMQKIGICGFGMGGTGALVAALRRPDRFRSASAFAPFSSPSRSAWGRSALTLHLGERPDAWREYDPTELVRTRRVAGKILVDHGAADALRREHLRPELFATACHHARQGLVLREHEGYDHSQHFVASFVDDHLEHHGRELAKEPTLQLYYASHANQPLDAAALDEMLAQARANNERLGITGMLLYRDGRFIQVLEGAPAVVRSLYARIEDDGRHTSVNVLWERYVDRREFPDWTMGFQRITSGDLVQRPGFVDFFARDFSETQFARSGQASRLLLLAFRRTTLGESESTERRVERELCR